MVIANLVTLQSLSFSIQCSWSWNA